MLHLPLALLAAGTPALQPGLPTAATALPPVEPLLYPAHAPADEGSEAADLSYTYLEVGNLQYDPDLSNDDANAYYLRAQLSLGLVYLFGQYQQQEFNTSELEFNTVDLGAGVHFPLDDQIQLQAELAAVFVNYDGSVEDLDDEAGYIGRVGARAMILPWSGGGLEAEANGVYRGIDLGELGAKGQWGGQIGARVHFLRLFSIGAMYTSVDGDTQGQLNARLSF